MWTGWSVEERRAASRVSRRRWVRLLLQIWSCAGPRFVQRCISGVTTCLGRVRRRPTLQMRGYAPFDVADMELSAPGAANMELPASAGALYSISAALVALNSISAALVIYNSKYAAGACPRFGAALGAPGHAAEPAPSRRASPTPPRASLFTPPQFRRLSGIDVYIPQGPIRAPLGCYNVPLVGKG